VISPGDIIDSQACSSLNGGGLSGASDNSLHPGYNEESAMSVVTMGRHISNALSNAFID
jgi:hypothetical protein